MGHYMKNPLQRVVKYVSKLFRFRLSCNFDAWVLQKNLPKFHYLKFPLLTISLLFYAIFQMNVFQAKTKFFFFQKYLRIKISSELELKQFRDVKNNSLERNPDKIIYLQNFEIFCFKYAIFLKEISGLLLYTECPSSLPRLVATSNLYPLAVSKPSTA